MTTDVHQRDVALTVMTTEAVANSFQSQAKDEGREPGDIVHEMMLAEVCYWPDESSDKMFHFIEHCYDNDAYGAVAALLEEGEYTVETARDALRDFDYATGYQEPPLDSDLQDAQRQIYMGADLRSQILAGNCYCKGKHEVLAEISTEALSVIRQTLAYDLIDYYLGIAPGDFTPSRLN